MSESEERQRVIASAMEWQGTPYHHRAQIKGVGVDCATLLVAAFQGAGLVGEVILPQYSPQWHLHHDDSKYLDFIAQFCAEVPREPLPGDIVVWKFHRCFAHGAIVINWPTVIHAFIGAGCIIDDAEKNQMLARVSERTALQNQPRPRKTMSFWGH